MDLDPRQAAIALRRRARRTHTRVRRLGLARVRPTVAQWEVLFALEASGALPPGGLTTIGAHVHHQAAEALRRADLVLLGEDGRYRLTEAGARRAKARL